MFRLGGRAVLVCEGGCGGVRGGEGKPPTYLPSHFSHLTHSHWHRLREWITNYITSPPKFPTISTIGEQNNFKLLLLLL